VNLPELAWRNVLRQKRRTLTSLSALIVGLTGLVVFQGYLGQTMKGYRDQTVLAGIGHLQVAAAPGYFTDGEFSPYSYGLGDASTLEASLKADRRVAAVFPSTGFTAIAGTGDKSATLLVKAFPADRMGFGTGAPPLTFHLGPLVSGSWDPHGGPDRIVLGETAARILKTEVGAVVTLMAILPDGGLNGRDFTVAAIYRSVGRDKIFAYTDLDSAQGFIGTTSPSVLHVLAHNADDTAALAATVSADHTVRTYGELAPFYVQVNSMFAGFLAVIRTILLLVTLFILANTMNRIVFERMREWGTLRALGTKARQILALVVLEGAFQGFLGAVFGILAGLTLSLLINLAGGIPYVNGDEVYQIKVALDADAVWWNLVPVVFTAALAAFVPALKAVALSPSEALRSV